MRQMGELEGKCDNQISTIKHRRENTDNCSKCGAIKMGIALLEAALAQHVDARTTGLGCVTTKN